MKILNNYENLVTLLVFLSFFCAEAILAQPVLPQREITIYASQSIDFGLFYDRDGSGGTISVDSQGSRTFTGGINTLPSYPGRPALFEVKLCQGRNVTITYPPTTILSGTNADQIIMEIGPTEKGGNGAVFATEYNCNFITILRVGATLTIPPNTKTGVFTGSFEISFDQQ